MATAGRTLGAVTDKAKAARVACYTVHVKDQYPADGILMASHGRHGGSFSAARRSES